MAQLPATTFHLPCAAIIRSQLGRAFERTYRDLADLYGDELTDSIVLNELADLFTELVMNPTVSDEEIEQCAGALEVLCLTDGIDPVDAVYDQVLSLMPPMAFERVRSYLGPAAERLLDSMEMEAEDEAAAAFLNGSY